MGTTEVVLRTAIVLSKGMLPGEAANVVAILAGHASRVLPELYTDQPPVDRTGLVHAGVRFSVVVLQANGPRQIANAAKSVCERFPTLQVAVFTGEGKALNNTFDAYRAMIADRFIDEMSPLGMVVFGSDEDVRRASKSFSLIR